jgi:hypothetical protein
MCVCMNMWLHESMHVHVMMMVRECINVCVHEHVAA